MTAQLLPNVYQQFFGITGSFSGLPLAGGKLFSYAAGTTTPLATYTDEGAGTPNTNPIILNSVGAANIWMGSLAYKFVLQDSAGVVQWTVDNVSYINPDSIDLTKINGDIAGLALAQNGLGELDVQVDNATIEIVGNELTLKAVPADLIPASSKMEVLYKQVRDFTCPGLIQTIPQYEWSNPTPLTIAATIPATAAATSKWSPNGEFLAVAAGTASPYVFIYQRSILNFTKLADPAILPAGQAHDLAWSPCGDFLVIGHAASPYITIYQRFGNEFVKLQDPVSLPPSDGFRVLFSPNSDFLTVMTLSGAFVIYERQSGVTTPLTGTYFGTASVTSTNTISDAASPGSGAFYAYVSAPTTHVASSGTSTGSITGTAVTASTMFVDITSTAGLTGIHSSMTWSPDSAFFAALDSATGNIDVFERTADTFFGITGPTGLTGITQLAWSPDGNFLAVLLNATPFIALFQATGGVFIQISNPTTLPTDSGNCLTWSANSEYLAIGLGVTPYVNVYQVSGSTFTRIADLATLPVGTVLSLDWTQTKQFLALASNTTPFFEVYETASVLPSNALIYTRGVPNV